MAYIKQFLMFWYDFIIGDDWTIAAGVVVGLLLTGWLAASGLNVWWLMPLVAAVVLLVSLWREVQKGH